MSVKIMVAKDALSSENSNTASKFHPDKLTNSVLAENIEDYHF